MRMVHGDVNMYWKHASLTPGHIRAAAYGTAYDSARLVPDEGDVISGFPGFMGEPLKVRVVKVEQIGQGATAYQITVETVTE